MTQDIHNTSQLRKAMKPWVFQWLQEAGLLDSAGGYGSSVVGGGGAPSPHDLSSVHHTGTLGDDQAPQFLKLDGSRTLTGNLDVNPGITIDGVDLSAHAANADAHHTAFVGLQDDFGSPINPDGSDRISVVSLDPLLFVSAGTSQLQLDLDASSNPGASAKLLKTDASGGLILDGILELNGTITSTGDLVLDPVGNDIVGVTGYELNLGTRLKPFLAAHIAELQVGTLVAKEEIATVGGSLFVAPTNILAADLAASGTTITVKYNNLLNGDTLLLRKNGAVEFLRVTSAASGSGPYTYTVTRNLDGGGANDWVAGDAIVNTLSQGRGWLEMYAEYSTQDDTQEGPTIVAQMRESNLYADWAPRAAFGRLKNLYDYTSGDPWGAAFGNPVGTWLGIDDTNGIRIMSAATRIAQWEADGDIKLGPTNALQLNADGSASFAGSISFGNGTHVGDATGLNVYASSNVDIFRAHDTSGLGGGVIVRDSMLMPGTIAGTVRRIVQLNTNNVYNRAEIQLSAGRGGTTDSYLLLGTQGVGATLSSTERLSLASYSQQGYIHVPLTTPASSMNWNGTNKGIIGWTEINLASEFGLPSQVRGVFARIVGTATAIGTHALSLGGNAANAAIALRAHSSTVADDKAGFVPCNASGNIYYTVQGAGFNSVTLFIMGYLI